jgi:hypothetical protein
MIPAISKYVKQLIQMGLQVLPVDQQSGKAAANSDWTLLTENRT